MAQTSRSSPAIGGAVPTQCKYALNWTRLSCHKFVANQVRLWLFVLTYNLGNFDSLVKTRFEEVPAIQHI